MSENREERVPVPTALPPSERGSTKGRQVRSYAIAAIFCFVLAGAVYILAQPEERKGPPQGQPQEQAEAGNMPPDHPQVGGQQEMQRPDLQQRLQQLQTEVEANPEEPAARLQLANILYDLGQQEKNPERFVEAISHYQTYLESKPDDPNARTDMAYSYYRTGNLEEAITQLYQVQKAYPDHQSSAFNLALMYKEKDQPDSVLAYMARVAEIDSTTGPGQAALEILRAYRDAH